MNTIKIYLAESGRVADLRKDFPLYKGQFNSKLLNVYVPTSILAPQFDIQHYIGQIQGTSTPTDAQLDAFVVANTYPSRDPEEGDIIEFCDTSDELTYYLYTYTDSSWTSAEVDSFGSFSSIAGTSIKIGMLATERDGKIYKSKSYYMRYLKTLTYQNVEYALYERKLPKEFTSFVGQGQNAPQLIINVVDVSTTDSKIESLITSQTCSLDVMQSNMLDIDEPIEASELDELYAALNSVASDLELKQDKQDNSLETISKFVVGAINEVNANEQRDKENIDTNTENIAQNKSDIDYLYEHMAQAEEYIGQMEGSSLPTDTQLTTYVETVAGREPKNADVIIYILEVTGGADKTYKYTYSIDSWNGYEIPPFEEAYNDTLGMIKGTYNVGSANNTIVDISGGEILNIYVKDDSNVYRNIREYLNTTTANIGKIIDGTTSVGVALKALADEVGNNIVNTYLTQAAGATKQFVRNYALPKTFNDIYYPVRDEDNANEGTYSTTLPDTAQDFSVTTSAVGDFTICELILENTDQRSFELSKKNSCENSFAIYTNRDCQARFRLTTSVTLDGETDPTLLDVELSDLITFYSGTTNTIKITSIFSYLGNDVIKFENENDVLTQKLEVIIEESASTTFTLTSNSSIPATFSLNSNSLVIYNTLGKLGEQPVFELVPSGDITASGINLIGSPAAQLYNNVECMLKIDITNATTGYTDYFYNVDNCQILTVTFGGQQIRLATPYNYSSGQPTFDMFDQLLHLKTSTASTYLVKCFIQIDGSTVTFYVDEDNVPDISVKMDKANPTGTGSLSINRNTNSIIGFDSVAVGFNCTASGADSFAEGTGCVSSGESSHSGGNNSKATGAGSFAFGAGVKASKANQFVFGRLNIEDVSSGDYGTYAEIVGNGTLSGLSEQRSNARTLDWDGNEELAGNMIVKGGKIGDGKNATYKLALPDTTNFTSDKTLATTSIIAEYTLTAANWSNNTYTLSVTGKTSSNHALVSNSNTGTDADVLANANAIGDANIYKITDNGTSLTFVCETTPTVDLKIQVEVYE